MGGWLARLDVEGWLSVSSMRVDSLLLFGRRCFFVVYVIHSPIAWLSVDCVNRCPALQVSRILQTTEMTGVLHKHSLFSNRLNSDGR
jgi:hypothetical protein